VQYGIDESRPLPVPQTEPFKRSVIYQGCFNEAELYTDAPNRELILAAFGVEELQDLGGRGGMNSGV
jgi:hypothetical protein